MWEAVRALATGEAGSRKRVVTALEILIPMKAELPEDLEKRLQKVRDNASRLKPGETKDSKVSIFEQASKGKYNKTYSKYASELMSIYDELNARANSND